MTVVAATSIELWTLILAAFAAVGGIAAFIALLLQEKRRRPLLEIAFPEYSASGASIGIIARLRNYGDAAISQRPWVSSMTV